MGITTHPFNRDPAFGGQIDDVSRTLYLDQCMSAGMFGQFFKITANRRKGGFVTCKQEPVGIGQFPTQRPGHADPVPRLRMKRMPRQTRGRYRHA